MRPRVASFLLTTARRRSAGVCLGLAMIFVSLKPLNTNHSRSIKNLFYFWNCFNSSVEYFKRSELLKTPGVLIIPGGFLVKQPMSQLLQGVVY